MRSHPVRREPVLPTRSRRGSSAFFLAIAALLASASLSSNVAGAQINRNGSESAIGGYDPVAYFTDHRPVRGSAEHAFEWHGARWLFATEEHRASFAASPERYAPAYGGHCAYAMADGRLVNIDPAAWSIVGGRLYLNYSLDIRATWLPDHARLIRAADDHWARIGGARR